jgi:uridylate kinase
VYDRDPRKHADAQLLTRLTYMDALKMGLKVMDATAISLSMENRIPLLVLDIATQGNLLKAVLGEQVGSTIEADPDDE